MLANLITVGRVGLVFVAIFLLYQRTIEAALLAFILVLTAIMMDALDGFLARKTHTESPLGAVMDILGDRIVENALWIVFAHLRLIPVWVPIVVVVRGFTTDAFRSVALTRGQTPFGEKTMIKSRLGRLLVSSRTSRALYAGAKVAAFCYIILYFAAMQCIEPCQIQSGQFFKWTPMPWAHSVGLGLVYFTVALCIIRALPVIQDGIALLRTAKG